MESSFPGYYRPTEDEFTDVWNNCLFVFDTSFLIDLNEYSEDAKESVIAILQHISDRIWIPHQVALEYHQHRMAIDLAQVKQQDKRLGLLEKVRAFHSALESLEFLEDDTLLEQVKQSLSALEESLQESEKHPTNLLEYQEQPDQIGVLFKNIGPPYPWTRLSEIYGEGEQRYTFEIPPGYKDKTKPGATKYGDLIIWYQIIDRAKEVQAPVIFVTSEAKEDWWLKLGGRIIAPRPELAQDLLFEAGVRFYIYRFERFVEYATRHFGLSVGDEVVDEIGEVERRRETRADLLHALSASGQLAEKMWEVEAAKRAFAEMTASPEMMRQFEASKRAIAEMTASPEMMRQFEASKRAIAEMAASPEMMRQFEASKRAIAEILGPQETMMRQMREMEASARALEEFVSSQKVIGQVQQAEDSREDLGGAESTPSEGDSTEEVGEVIDSSDTDE